MQKQQKLEKLQRVGLNQFQHEQSIEKVSQSAQSEEFINTKAAGRNNICCICRSSTGKYTCPKCKRHTCSVNCNKKHKQLKQCNGVQEAYQYTSMANYKQQHAIKDFTYLKEMLQSTDKVKKCLTGVTVPVIQPKRFKILRNNAKKIHNVDIIHAPTIIQRHNQNISFFYVKTKQVYWVFEVLFFQKSPQKSKSAFSKIITAPTPQNKTLAQLVTQCNFLCKDLILDNINTMKTEQFSVFIEIKSRYRYRNPNMNIEETKNNNYARKFSPSQRICNCIKDMTVYEFPTIIFVHKSLQQRFLEMKKYQIVANPKIRQEENEKLQEYLAKKQQDFKE